MTINSKFVILTISQQIEIYMKFLTVLILAAVLTACGTVGGAVSGAGTDLTRAGEWIRSR